MSPARIFSGSKMRVSVLYFAVLRERAGRDSDTLELPAGAHVREARAAIAGLRPAIGPLLPRVQTAVNRIVVPEDHPLAEGDELALLPPLSGGAGLNRLADHPTIRPAIRPAILRRLASIRRARSPRCTPSR
jgi:molybdopterin converting factor subunit 1